MGVAFTPYSNGVAGDHLFLAVVTISSASRKFIIVHVLSGSVNFRIKSRLDRELFPLWEESICTFLRKK